MKGDEGKGGSAPGSKEDAGGRKDANEDDGHGAGASDDEKEKGEQSEGQGGDGAFDEDGQDEEDQGDDEAAGSGSDDDQEDDGEEDASFAFGDDTLTSASVPGLSLGLVITDLGIRLGLRQVVLNRAY